jgi:uncharacterized lipoprotein YddW (UPF0748 family)
VSTAGLSGTPLELSAAEMPPPEPRELRAAWVATVANIDWPSKPGLGPDAMRAEATALLDKARALNLNAVVLQVRPAGDAIHASRLEPWSEFLAGAQGRDPGFDALAFWLAGAHRRGLQLHAWLNPYRARHSLARSPLAPPHLALREPAVVKAYGEQLWMDPGEPAAFAHTLAVARDLLARYDVDALHIDDYFYPYPIAAAGAGAGNGGDLPFPDQEVFIRYRAAGGLLDLADWRRANVDAMVQALHRSVRELRPHSLFGISPFGIGRPDRRPAGVSGLSQYDKLYADVERWFEEGWLDYLAPQLYWPIDRAGQAFPLLLDYWIGANRRQRHLWPGLFTSRVRKDGEPPGRDAWPARELIEQIARVRSRASAAGGHIHFSLIALAQDRDGLATLLQFGPYAEPALVPATPWLDAVPPAAPRLSRSGSRVRVDGARGSGAAVAGFAVWRRTGGRWHLSTLPAASAQERIIALDGADAVVASAIGRTGLASERTSLRTPP